MAIIWAALCVSSSISHNTVYKCRDRVNFVKWLFFYIIQKKKKKSLFNLLQAILEHKTDLEGKRTQAIGQWLTDGCSGRQESRLLRMVYICISHVKNHAKKIQYWSFGPLLLQAMVWAVGYQTADLISFPHPFSMALLSAWPFLTPAVGNQSCIIHMLKTFFSLLPLYLPSQWQSFISRTLWRCWGVCVISWVSVCVWEREPA